MLGLTVGQATAIAIVVAMLGFFIWDRWRYDVVAVTALLAAVVAGVVPAGTATLTTDLLSSTCNRPSMSQGMGRHDGIGSDRGGGVWVSVGIGLLCLIHPHRSES